MSTKKYILILIGLLCPLYGSILGQSEHPNIILILADDQGWDGTSVQMDDKVAESKSDFYQTPRLEQMAAEGMKFSRAYSASPVCSPSRYAILTGMSPARLGMTDILKRNPLENVDLACPHSSDDIDPSLTTLPQALKAIEGANYYCGSFGKWHIDENDPTEAGYDVADGPNANGSGNEGETLNEDPKRIFSVTDQGMEFIDSAVENEQPFFLQLNHFAVHLWPKSKPESYETVSDWEQGEHFYKIYGAMTLDLDESVGLVMDHLKSLGIEDNTYIIYTSDNGSVEFSKSSLISPSRILQKGKTHIWEGGIRVPLLVKGPGIEAGSQSDVNFNGTDLYATILDLAGKSGQVGTADSKSKKSVLFGDEGSNNDFRVYHFPHYAPNKWGIPQTAIIQGDFKFSIDFYTGESLFFDIANDPGETLDLSEISPSGKIVLYKKLRDYLQSVNAPMPSLNPYYVRYSGEAPDLDQDGMDDEWEIESLLTAAFGGDVDTDGDGFNNLDEFKKQTDPLDAEDFLLNGANFQAETETQVMRTPNGFQLTLDDDGVKEVLVSDLSGKIVLQRSVQGESTVNIVVSENFSALYFIQIKSADQTETQHFIR